MTRGRRHGLGLALGLAITGVGIATTAGSVGRDTAAWVGFAVAFVVFFAASGLLRFADSRRALVGSRAIPTATVTVGIGLGVGVGFALVHAVGAGARLVVVAACGGFIVGAAVFYWVFPVESSADRRS